MCLFTHNVKGTISAIQTVSMVGIFLPFVKYYVVVLFGQDILVILFVHEVLCC